MSGIDLITQERWRQVDEEGYDLGHDSEHIGDELALAAAVYALPRYRRNEIPGGVGPTLKEGLWPAYWDFKPGPDRIRELAKAGALIAAEIDLYLAHPIWNEEAST